MKILWSLQKAMNVGQFLVLIISTVIPLVICKPLKAIILSSMHENQYFGTLISDYM